MWFVWLAGSCALLWIVYGWAVESWPALARRKRAVLGVLAAIVAVQMVTHRIVMRSHDATAGAVQTAAMVALMTLWIAALPIAIVRIVAFAIARIASPVPRAAGALSVMSRRQVIEAASGSAILASTGSMLGWGSVRGRHAFELHELPVRIAGLPRALDGYVIAQISDVHTGAHVGEGQLDEGLDLVRRARPDLVVVTGDLVDIDGAYAPLIARKLAGLTARDGVRAILGNHDYYTGADLVASTVRAAGVDVLVNEGRVIRAGDGGGFALLGVDDLWSVRYRRAGPRLDRALDSVPADLPRILLSHQPNTVDAWAGRVALQLSGHTHGGQINPGFRPADFLFDYVAGAYSVRGTTLYVNRGFGTVGPPSRVGAPPEVTRVVLVAG